MSDLPPGLYRHGRQYRCKVYRDGRRVWMSLGPDLQVAAERLAEIRGDAPGTLDALLSRYKRDVIPGKAPKTQREQNRQAERLRKVFGHMLISQLRARHAVKYLDLRGNVAGNREIALLRHVLTKAVHWGLVQANPLRGLQYRNPERARTRVVESRELRYVMRRAQPRERYLIWLVYLTGLRRADALALTRFNLKDDAIHLREGKTGKAARIAWTPHLRRLVERIKALGGGDRLFEVSASGADTAWQRLRRRLAADGYELFQLKDVRAMHAGDLEDRGGDATRQLGHSSRAVTQAHYLRKGRVVVPLK